MIEAAYHDPLLYKAIGAALGTTAGLVYIKPRNRRDALGRAFFSSSTALTFYFVPMEYLGWPVNPERIWASTFLMAFLAWPLAGVLFKWVSEKAKAE